MRLATTVALALLLSTTVAEARGRRVKNPHLARGIELLDQAEDEQALEELEKALAWSKGRKRRRGRARIHLYLGITCFNLADQQAARRHFRAAFRLNRAIELPEGLSPKIQKFVAELREEQPEPPPRPPPTISPPRPAPGPSPVTPVVVRRDKPSALTYWPAWTALGVAVAAGGTGLALGLLSRNKADEANDLRQPTSVAQASHDTAKKMALSANILFGVAGAAAIASAVLFYVGSQRRAAGTTAQVVPLNGGAVVQLQGVVW